MRKTSAADLTGTTGAPGLAASAGTRGLFRLTSGCAHNEVVNDAQLTSQCPRCGSTAQVHSVGELADLARMRLAQLQGQTPAAPQQGWAAEPVAGAPPGPGGRQPGGLSGRTAVSGPGGYRDNPAFDGVGDAVADVALGAAAQFLGRAITRKVQRAMTDRVVPALSQSATTALQNQIAVAETYPDLRACLRDQVIFLAGGRMTQPMPDLGKITVAQADALVGQLRG